MNATFELEVRIARERESCGCGPWAAKIEAEGTE